MMVFSTSSVRLSTQVPAAGTYRYNCNNRLRRAERYVTWGYQRPAVLIAYGSTIS